MPLERSYRFVRYRESAFLFLLRPIQLLGSNSGHGVSFSFKGMPFHLDPGGVKGLPALGDAKGDEGECLVFSESAIRVLK